jgi:hypothetical protein
VLVSLVLNVPDALSDEATAADLTELLTIAEVTGALPGVTLAELAIHQPKTKKAKTR